MNPEPSPVMRIVHVALGAAAVALGFHASVRGVASVVLVIGAIAYVAWMARRGAGLSLALVAGALELLRQRAHMVAPADALAITTMWLLLYLVVALIASGIEVATRPVPR
jgi:hypothetical protein